MKVHGIVWAGTRTDRFEETVAFFRDLLGVPLTVIGPGFAWSKMANSSHLEIFGPQDRDHEIFDTGPVPEFLVDDVHTAAAELRAAGVELLDEVQGTAQEGWVHFRAPDGNVYGVCSGPDYRR